MMTHQRSTDWIASEEELQSSLQKVHSTQRSFAIALLCAVQTVMLGSGVLALLFGFMITSQGLRKLQQESPSTIDRGESVVIWPTNIYEKDINDMVLAGHDVQSIVESNVYNGLKAKLQFNTWKRI